MSQPQQPQPEVAPQQSSTLNFTYAFQEGRLYTITFGIDSEPMPPQAPTSNTDTTYPLRVVIPDTVIGTLEQTQVPPRPLPVRPSSDEHIFIPRNRITDIEPVETRTRTRVPPPTVRRATPRPRSPILETPAVQQPPAYPRGPRASGSRRVHNHRQQQASSSQMYVADLF